MIESKLSRFMDHREGKWIFYAWRLHTGSGDAKLRTTKQ